MGHTSQDGAQDEPTPAYAEDIHTPFERHALDGTAPRPHQKGMGVWSWVGIGLIGGVISLAAMLPESEPITPAERAAYVNKHYLGEGAIPPKSYMIDWVFAYQVEREATAATFAATLFPNRGRDQQGQPTAELIWYTQVLTTCISDNAHQDTVNHIRISRAAAVCIASLSAPHLLEEPRR